MRDPGAEPRLVVPAGLVIDENVRERLTRALAQLPTSVAGIGAEIADLEPGASYRVHNEWLSLDPTTPRAAASTVVHGAVLLRAHVEFALRDGLVEIPRGSVVVDPGAQVHDPRRPTGPTVAASDRGRPPFPRRPVVVFLACEPVGDPDWLRRLVNRLVRHDVEARIAMPEPVAGGEAPAAVHLTRPSLACEATIRALAPDVVVTLDRAAAGVVDAWCSGNRSTVVVDFDSELEVPMELVSWQIGHASGRLRARIGPWVDVPEFAALVNRLGAGPHPVPPADDVITARPPVLEHWTSGALAANRRCVVLTGALDAAADARLRALADNLEAAAVEVVVASHAGGGVATEAAAAARAADLLVLAGLPPAPEIDELIATRRAAGRTTAVDLGPRDLDSTETAQPTLTAAAGALGDASGLVLAPGGALHSAAHGAGRRALVFPTLLARARAAALRDARALADPAGVLVIGWRLGAAGGQPEYATAVAEGIARLLTEHRERVEIVGAAEQVPAALRGHERVGIVAGAGELDPEVIAHWAVHVWTPGLCAGEIVDDARLFEEASCAGVPSVMPVAATRGVDGFVSPHVLVEAVDRPDDWYDALHHVLDDPVVRARRAREATRRADALDGPAISKAAVSRLIGLASSSGERTKARA